MPRQPIIKPRGLNTADNPLSLEPGWFTNLLNISLDDGSIRPRRPIYTLNDWLLEGPTEPDAVGKYGDFMVALTDGDIRLYAVDQSDDGFLGTYDTGFYRPPFPHAIRIAEANGSLYFTTSTGIARIDSATSPTFGNAVLAGMPPGAMPALGATLYADTATYAPATTSYSGAPIPSGSRRAYRIVFGYSDANGNVITGEPGGRFLSPIETFENAYSFRFKIPSEITSSMAGIVFWRLYASKTSSEPQDDLYLANEQFLTSAELAAGYTDRFTDIAQDSQLGEALYTNSDQEGILESNLMPPRAGDISLFAGSMFYANTKNRGSVSVQMFSLPRPGESIVIGGQTYSFHGEDYEAEGQEIAVPLSASLAADIRDTCLLLCDRVNRYSTSVRAKYMSSPIDPPGLMLFENRSISSAEFTITTSASALQISELDRVFGNGYTEISFSVPHNAVVGDRFTLASGNTSLFPPGLKTVTAVPSSTILRYAEDGITANVASDPGYSISWLEDPGQRFQPSILSTGSGIASKSDEKPGRLFFSKKGFPDSVPAFNYVDVGNPNKAIIAIASMRDALYVLKEDGVYRVVGDDPSNFTWGPLDETVECTDQRYVQVLSNRIFTLSNQGVVSISESGIAIISNPIANRISLEETGQPSSFSSESAKIYGFRNTISNEFNVFSLNSGSWSIWSFPEAASVLCFGTGSGVNDVLLAVGTSSAGYYFGAINMNNPLAEHRDRIGTTNYEISSTIEFVETMGDPTSFKHFREVQLIVSYPGSDAPISGGTATFSANPRGAAIASRSASVSIGLTQNAGPNGGSYSRIGVPRTARRASWLKVELDFNGVSEFKIDGIIVDATHSGRTMSSSNE